MKKITKRQLKTRIECLEADNQRLEEAVDYYSKKHMSHKDFQDLCYRYNLDRDKIVLDFEKIFLSAIYRGGSWERKAIETMFDIENIQEDYKKK